LPFINPTSRDKIRIQGCDACEVVGDICFVFYSHMMKAWNEERRWRTAHRLYRSFILEPETNEYLQYVYDRILTKFEKADVITAGKLAYEVFFNLEVMKYEKEMMERNGGIL
jgi:hypothetical protein